MCRCTARLTPWLTETDDTDKMQACNVWQPKRKPDENRHPKSGLAKWEQIQGSLIVFDKIEQLPERNCQKRLQLYFLLSSAVNPGCQYMVPHACKLPSVNENQRSSSALT